MNPSIEIGRVFEKDRLVVGQVLTVRGNKLVVSTAAGVREVENTSAQLVSPGDLIKLSGYTFLGKVLGLDRVPIFQV